MFGTMFSGNFIIFVVTLTIFGFFSIGLMPISFEFGCEQHFPIGEGIFLLKIYINIFLK